MAHDPIATRYAEALFEAAKAERQLSGTLEQLERLADFLRQTLPLRQLLGNPGIAAEEKVATLDRLLDRAWPPLVRAFVHMVIASGRADYLPEIADALQREVDADQGRLRVVVRSAHRLPAAQLTRLRTQLEARERKQITLRAEVDPALLGGLQIRLDYRVIDGSVQRQLTELRERLTAVRVY